jgi:predicted membrane protein
MTSKITFGGLLIIAGAILLLAQFGLVDSSYIFSTFWPIIFIFIGSMQFIFNRGKAGKIISLILILFGSLFLINNLDFLPWDVSNMFWPMILILFGLWIIFPKKLMEDNVKKNEKLENFVLFSGLKTSVTNSDYKTGEVSAFFGGLEVDFTQAKIQNEAEIEVNAIFGGVVLRVPKDWRIVIEGDPLFGGFENQTKNQTNAESPVLIVRGSVAFGGVEVKN